MKALRRFFIPLAVSILALGCARSASAGHLIWGVAPTFFGPVTTPLDYDPGTWAGAVGIEGMASVPQPGLYYTQLVSAGMAAHLAPPGVGGHAKGSVEGLGHWVNAGFLWIPDFMGDPPPLVGTSVTWTQIAVGAAAVDADPGNSSHAWVSSAAPAAATDSVLPWGTLTPHMGQNASYFHGPWFDIRDEDGNVITNENSYTIEQWLWSGLNNEGASGFTISSHVTTSVTNWSSLPSAVAYLSVIGMSPTVGENPTGPVEIGSEGSGTGFHDGTVAFVWTDIITGTYYGTP